jgi:serine/threonine protein kinase
MDVYPSKDFTEIRNSLSERGYTLLKLIGSGRYGAVFTVHMVKFNIIYAVKIMDRFDEHGNDIGSSYECEVEVLMTLVHPNIVSVYAFFASAHYHFVVLEYCENGTLAELLEHHHHLEGPTLRELCRQTAMALSYLHSANFSHRDLKPANILIDKYGRPKLADFGFARKGLTNNETGKIVGSLPYMSPELISGHYGADPFACDVWALGVTFYRTAFGSLPWNMDSASVLSTDIMQGDIAIDNDVSPPLSAMIRQMLERLPAARITMAEVLQLPYFEAGNSGPKHSSLVTVGDASARSSRKPVRMERANRAAPPLARLPRVKTLI